MKRYISVVLIFTILFSLTGCDFSTKAVGDQLKDKASEVANELVDSAVDKAKDTAASKLEKFFDSLCFWKKDSDQSNTDNPCESCTYVKKAISKDNIFTKVNENLYVIECSVCTAPYPVEELNFSLFLKYYYPKAKNISDKQKEKALEHYIRTKALMVGNKISTSESYTSEASNTTLGAFEFIGTIASSPAELKEKIPILNSESFFLFQNYLPAAFSDVGIQVDFLDTVQIVGGVCDFAALCSAAETATTAGNHYTQEKEKGKSNIYATREAYIDYALANANMMAAFANFLGNFDISVGAPAPNISSVLEDVKELAKRNDMKTYYQHLSEAPSLINKYKTVNDVLNDHGITPFAEVEVKTYPTDSIEAAMKKGPTAKEIAEAIPYVIMASNQSEEGLTEMISSALWYYYGWRLNYEYDMFIKWIYADEYCSYESFLTNPPS